MKRFILAFSILLIPFLANAKDKKQDNPFVWDNLITTTETEVYIDSTAISNQDGVTLARLKTVYTTPESRAKYVDKIKKVFTKNADKKIQKWDDFQYTITYGLYDCVNGRFKILKVEDFDSTDKRIVKTEKKEDKAIWTNVDPETVGDYMLFNICDYNPLRGNVDGYNDNLIEGSTIIFR